MCIVPKYESDFSDNSNGTHFFAGVAAQIFFTLAAPVCVLPLQLFLQL